MTTPLIEDPLLVKELDRHFKTHYSDDQNNNEENDAASASASAEISDPRDTYPSNSQLESIQAQRQRAKSYANSHTR